MRFSGQPIQKQFYSNEAAIFDDENCAILFNNCEKEDCLGMNSFIGPKSLTYGFSDQELFWRAPLVPKMDKLFQANLLDNFVRMVIFVNTGMDHS